MALNVVYDYVDLYCRDCMIALRLVFTACNFFCEKFFESFLFRVKLIFLLNLFVHPNQVTSFMK